jgi:hypothetical protein
MRARCILVKTSDSVIENNTFYNTHMTAILAGPEFYWGEAPAVRNLRKNELVNLAFSDRRGGTFKNIWPCPWRRGPACNRQKKNR